MAESGGFRIAFRGFNKDDVLKYINDMQRNQEKRLEAEKENRLAAEEQLAEALEAAQTAVNSLEELKATAAELQAQNEQLTSLAQLYKNEILQLREQAQEDRSDEENTALKNAMDRVTYLEEHVARLTEQNARYAKIVGDVNRVVVEARVISASYLDSAQRKSKDCLNRLDMFLDDLKQQTKQAVQSADERREMSDVYMKTLLEDLQQLGASFDSER